MSRARRRQRPGARSMTAAGRSLPWRVASRSMAGSRAPTRAASGSDSGAPGGAAPRSVELARPRPCRGAAAGSFRCAACRSRRVTRAPPRGPPALRPSGTIAPARASSATKSSTASAVDARPEPDLLDQPPAVDRHPIAEPHHRLPAAAAPTRAAPPRRARRRTAAPGRAPARLPGEPQQLAERDAPLARHVHGARAPAGARRLESGTASSACTNCNSGSYPSCVGTTAAAGSA